MMLTVLLLLKFGDSPLKMYRLVEFRITFHLTRTLRANECRRKKFRINHEFCKRHDEFSLKKIKCQPSPAPYPVEGGRALRRETLSISPFPPRVKWWRRLIDISDFHKLLEIFQKVSRNFLKSCPKNARKNKIFLWSDGKICNCPKKG